MFLAFIGSFFTQNDVAYEVCTSANFCFSDIFLYVSFLLSVGVRIKPSLTEEEEEDFA